MSTDQEVMDALRGTHMSTENYKFKETYLKTFEITLLIALAVHVLAIWLTPPIEIQPYRLKDERIQAVDIPDEIVIPPPPEEVQAPQLPTELEISDDVSVDETLPETDFNPFAPPEIPEEGGTGEAFYAFDTPPSPIKTEAPEYPELARQAGAAGTVLVEVTIDENGRVVATRVVQSDTIASLEEAAMKAARNFLFTPAKQRDMPVKCKIAIPFQFGLN